MREVNTNKYQKRDYDKNPIIIEDYNPLFQWLSFKYVDFAIIIMAFVIVDIYFAVEPLKWGKLLIFIPIGIWPLYNNYKNAKGKREIFLYNDKICYKHNNQIISEIFFDKTPKLFRSFQNFYHKSQELSYWYLILIFLIGLLITKSLFVNSLIFCIVFSLLLINFQITKWIISKNSYRFFHSILAFQDDEIIGISLLNENDYIEVKEYFSEREVCINTLPLYYKFFYSFEQIKEKS